MQKQWACLWSIKDKVDEISAFLVDKEHKFRHIMRVGNITKNFLVYTEIDKKEQYFGKFSQSTIWMP